MSKLEHDSSEDGARLSDAVSAALRHVDYFNRFALTIIENENQRDHLLSNLCPRNSYIEPIDNLVSDFGRSEIIEEALRQVEHERATRLAALPITIIIAYPQLPISVPFMVQHHIMVAAQSLAETVCFALVQSYLPDLLRKRNWDCPEAASLPTWLDAINDYPDGSTQPTFDLDNPHIQSMLILQKAAAERSPVSYDRLKQGVVAVAMLIGPLSHGMFELIVPYLRKLHRVLGKFPNHVNALSRIADSQLAQLHDTMAEIHRRRAALDAEAAAAQQHAKDAIAKYEAEWDADYRALFNAQ